jgi:hypothetical protein
MAIQDDIASDLTDFDWTETVTLYDQSANTSDTSVTALRRALNHRDMMMIGPAGLEPDDITFHIQVNTTAIVPTDGDTITDGDSNVYTILSVVKATLGTRWRCACRLQK